MASVNNYRRRCLSNMMRKNPYRLSGDISGVGVKIADEIAGS